MRTRTAKIVVGILTVMLSMAMAQTASAGSAGPELTLSATEVIAGSTVTVGGHQCSRGPIAVLFDGEVVADGLEPVSGTEWTYELTVPADTAPGEYPVTAICGVEASPYEALVLTVSAAPTTTAAPATTEVPPTSATAPTTAAPAGGVAGDGDAREDAELAYTGRDYTPTVILGLTAIVAGVALILMRRRATA